jgi:hypothetical protein
MLPATQLDDRIGGHAGFQLARLIIDTILMR